MEEENTINSFKRYISSIEQKIESYENEDEDYYKYEIEELELNLILLRKVLTILNSYNELRNNNKEAINYMYDLLNTDIINIGTSDINNLLSILEK